MKRIYSLIAALAVSTALSTPALARDTIFALSSQQSAEALKKDVERSIAHMMKTLKPGEIARVYDASRVKLVATFTAPTGKGAGNPRMLLNANGAALGGLKTFIKDAEAVPGRIDGINLPAVLRSIREHYPSQKGADLIILGSPVLDDPQAPSLSMRNGRVPNDGHLAARLSESLYATKGTSGSLSGYDVYFGTTGEAWKVSQAHDYYLRRFWSLSVEGHGGNLAFFGDDLETLFGRAGKDVPVQKHSEPLVATDKLEMLQFAPDTGKVADIYSEPLKTEPAPEPLWRAARNPRIGINWREAKADLDLYVRPSPSAPVIFFGQSQTQDGKLFKDFTNSPVNGFETVALQGEFDLSAMQIAVNFFGGRVPEKTVTGELRIAIGDQVWAKPFTIKAQRGNKGKGVEKVLAENKPANKAWVVIDPVSVIAR
ncbi:MAG: hypothetical protein ABJN40_07390 [Sneathiella sp.]